MTGPGASQNLNFQPDTPTIGPGLTRLMKISIELKDEDRSKLLQMATEQPDRGLAELVSEAIDRYLRSQERSELRKEKTTALRGCISSEQADGFRETLAKIRSSWR